MSVRLVFGSDDLVAKWIGERVQIDDFGPCVTMSIVDEEGVMLGGCLFNNYRPPNIEATIATIGSRWCSRRVLAGIFSYPFGQLGCKRVTAITEVMNQPARAFLCRLGFQQEGVLRQAFPNGTDAVVYGMLSSECRWFTAEEPMRRVAA